MTRKECLDKAAECVLQDRNFSYGGPEDSFGLIADLWTAYTGHVFIGRDVAAMMALLKLARMKRNPGHFDSAVDLAGYAACFAECATVEMSKPVPFASKAEGVEELVVSPFDAPQTKEELYDRIVANNPAVFGRAHKPTGEELAEMAEEEGR